MNYFSDGLQGSRCDSDRGVRLGRALKIWTNGSGMWRGSSGGFGVCVSGECGVRECV